MNERRSRRLSDAGVSLAELIVYSLLLSIVSLIAITIIVQVLKVNNDVQAVTSANNKVQVSFTQLETDLRSASQAVVSDGGNLLVIRTRVATTTTVDNWRCVGYYYAASTGDLHRVAAAGDAATTAALNAGGGSATAGIAAGWPVVLTDVERLSDPAGGGGLLPLFGPAQEADPTIRTTIDKHSTVQMNVGAATAPGRKPVELRKNVTIRPQGGSAAGCAG